MLEIDQDDDKDPALMADIRFHATKIISCSHKRLVIYTPQEPRL